MTKFNKAELDKLAEELAVEAIEMLKAFNVFSEDLKAEESEQVGGDHYNALNDPIQFARDNFSTDELRGFFKINIIKYIQRYPKKNGIEDIKKARHYIDLLLELERSECAKKEKQDQDKLKKIVDLLSKDQFLISQFDDNEIFQLADCYNDSEPDNPIEFMRLLDEYYLWGIDPDGLVYLEVALDKIRSMEND